MPASPPDRDYVLRYSSQQHYEKLGARLRMLKEWRVRPAACWPAGWLAVRRRGQRAKGSAGLLLCHSRLTAPSSPRPLPALLPAPTQHTQDGVPRGAYKGVVAVRNPLGARIFLAPTPEVDFSGACLGGSGGEGGLE